MALKGAVNTSFSKQSQNSRLDSPDIAMMPEPIYGAYGQPTSNINYNRVGEMQRSPLPYHPTIPPPHPPTILRGNTNEGRQPLPLSSTYNSRRSSTPGLPAPLPLFSRAQNSGDTKELKHCCTRCSKKFPYASKLNDHFLSHEKMKKFKCPHCDKKYIRKRELVRHLRKAHPQFPPNVPQPEHPSAVYGTTGESVTNSEGYEDDGSSVYLTPNADVEMTAVNENENSYFPVFDYQQYTFEAANPPATDFLLTGDMDMIKDDPYFFMESSSPGNSQWSDDATPYYD
ncbi:Zinc finger protein plagl2 [Rhizina undulata]